MAKKTKQKTDGKKLSVGRPSKYEPELIEKVAQYIQQSLKKGNQEELPIRRSQFNKMTYGLYNLLTFISYNNHKLIRAS
jgi:hypothetical protein